MHRERGIQNQPSHFILSNDRLHVLLLASLATVA
jgi:hypothetical protein